MGRLHKTKKVILYLRDCANPPPLIRVGHSPDGMKILKEIKKTFRMFYIHKGRLQKTKKNYSYPLNPPPHGVTWLCRPPRLTSIPTNKYANQFITCWLHHLSDPHILSGLGGWGSESVENATLFINF